MRTILARILVKTSTNLISHLYYISQKKNENEKAFESVTAKMAIMEIIWSHLLIC